jgi:hypothetical protein
VPPAGGAPRRGRSDIGKTLAKSLALAVVAPALVIGLGGRPSQAHNDWGLPLVGGLVGGYGLSTLINRDRERDRWQAYSQPAPTYAAAAPSAGSTAASIEHQLNVLDDLAAKGNITKEEYQSRRQALLNQL